MRLELFIISLCKSFPPVIPSFCISLRSVAIFERYGFPILPYTASSTALLNATVGVGEKLFLTQINNRLESMPSSLYSVCRSQTYRSSHQKIMCASLFVTESAFSIIVFTNVLYSSSVLLSFVVPPYRCLLPTPLSYESPILKGTSSSTKSAFAPSINLFTVSLSRDDPQIKRCLPKANKSPV